MCSVKVLLLPVGDMGGAVRSRMRPGVCRRLFSSEGGAVPRDILRTMEERLRADERARWNFDFERGAPLPGRFQWVPVVGAPAESVDVEEVERKPRRHGAGAEAMAKQQKITDFLTKRKRPLEASPSPQMKKVARLSAPHRATVRPR